MHSKSNDEELADHPLQSQQMSIDANGFPSVRYFQIHFEYMQEQLQRSVKLMENLQHQVMQLEQQLLNISEKKQPPATGPQLNEALKAPLIDLPKHRVISNTAKCRESEESFSNSTAKVKLWQN